MVLVLVVARALEGRYGVGSGLDVLNVVLLMVTVTGCFLFFFVCVVMMMVKVNAVLAEVVAVI